MKLHEWAGNIDPWGAYESDPLAVDFREATGEDAPWIAQPTGLARRISDLHTLFRIKFVKGKDRDTRLRRLHTAEAAVAVEAPSGEPHF